MSRWRVDCCSGFHCLPPPQSTGRAGKVSQQQMLRFSSGENKPRYTTNLHGSLLIGAKEGVMIVNREREGMKRERNRQNLL